MTTLPRSDLTDGAGFCFTEAASPGTSELTHFTPAGSVLPDVSCHRADGERVPCGHAVDPFRARAQRCRPAPVFSAEPIYFAARHAGAAAAAVAQP